MLRTSSYTIYVDLPDSDQELLLVHGYTGAYDRVSRRVADFLRAREVRRAPKPLYGAWSRNESSHSATEATSDQDPQLDPELSAVLRQRGYLTNLSPEQEESFFVRFVERLQARARQQMPSYIFMPTYDCNLRCSYCFQDHMRTDCSFRHLLQQMRPAIVDRIFAAMPEIEARHGISLQQAAEQGRNIGFFGGEPLLAKQRPIVELIMERARALGKASFWAVTNGTELQAYEDLLGPQGIARLQITLDGPPEEHDQRRIDAEGGGTFERIAGNIDLALSRGCQVSVRLNVDRNNIHELPQLARELQRRGWPGQQGFSAYTAPITPGNDPASRRSTFSSWQLDRALTELREEHPEMELLARPDEGVRARARRIFDQGQGTGIPELRPNFCSAHDRMYIFDPFADIYACWERTGDPNIRIARVTPEAKVEFRFEEHDTWRGRTVASNPVCRRCRYALHCGGGCAVLALQQRGKLYSNYCDGFASRFRASVAEAYQAHCQGEKAPECEQRVCDQ